LLCSDDLLCFGILKPDKELLGNDTGSPGDTLLLLSLPDFSAFVQRGSIPEGPADDEEDTLSDFGGTFLLCTRLEVVLLYLSSLGVLEGGLDRLGSRSCCENSGFELLLCSL
jgi:hypothetical protein